MVKKLKAVEMRFLREEFIILWMGKKPNAGVDGIRSLIGTTRKNNVKFLLHVHRVGWRNVLYRKILGSL